MTTMIFATRPSALARWQTRWVIQALQAVGGQMSYSEKVITTQGDRILDKPLPEIGGKGVFTQELESELLDGRVDAAVHSLKDLPVENPPGLVVGCIPLRGEARDVLISPHGYHLDGLPSGAIVGTSSLRRAAQILMHRPDLRIESLRGNVDTRLRKVLDGQYDAILLAGAGLVRLGLQAHITHWLPLDVMLPAPGQGALAIQCRADDTRTLQILAALDDKNTRNAVNAERAFLAGLGGGCALPVAAYARTDGKRIHLTGLALSPDGSRSLRLESEGCDVLALGSQLALQALARGAGELLHLVTAD